MARRPTRKAPPPHPLIEFSQPIPTAGDYLIRVVLDTHSKLWGFYETEQTPTHESSGDDDLPVDLDYPFNTVADATVGALRHVEPYWGGTSALFIEGGVAVPGMPVNARIVGSPGYRAAIDGGLYDLNQAELQAVHERTRRQSDVQARETAIEYDIPTGQQVHAFRELYEKLWPRHLRKPGSYPRLNDWLDQMMPKVEQRTRERHFKTFAIVSSDDWPVILATTEVEITGMDSILAAARAFSPPRSRRRKVRTPLRARYQALRSALLRRRYEEGRRLALRFDEEDDDDAPEGSYTDDDPE
jgi:hypothetical protein